ncbi:MAG TPA: lanthionine synthetase C family protein [Thermoanaerobaculia bacterium]|nr:lanthionine synthetase C family protein [Thermoanaerobaculia bacterium]
MSTQWKPLLQGELAEQARQSVQEIAAALESLNKPEAEGFRSSSVAGGQSGEALFYTYLALDTGDEASAERAAQLIEQAAEALAVQPQPPNLYTGFAGVAWTMEHLRGRLFEDDGEDEDPVEEIDEALAIPLKRSPWPGDYDLITGLVGLAVYALERLPRPAAQGLLASVVDRLSERADISEEGAAWFTQPEELPEWQREFHPKGNYNLGVAHGLPAVVAVLAGAAAAGIEKAGPLLNDSVRFLLARQQDPSVGSSFSTAYAPWEPPSPSRLAWCYGDPGVAAALLAAAHAVGNSEWEQKAVEVALAAVARPAEGSGIRDAGICHGAAGLGHLFNRMYNTTGEQRLGEAARFWYERALSYREPGLGVGGYRCWGVIGGPTELGWRDEPGFLEGSAGIGLSLLGAISEVEPAWDRLLTLSVRTVDG